MREARIYAGKIVRQARREGKKAEFGIAEELGDLAVVWWMCHQRGTIYLVNIEDLKYMGNKSYREDYAMCTIAR